MVFTKKLAIGLVAILVFGACGFFAASKIWGFPVFGEKTQKPPKQDYVPSAMLTLGQLVTNLSDSNRYIRLTIDLEVSSEYASSITEKASELKTDVYALLRTKSFKELSGEEGLRELQKEIRARFEEKVPGVVRNVFFSEFLIT